jgi:A/G-specific adenine glycosylase
MKAWAGLGYYSRARNLHACAQIIARDHQGHFPDTEQGLRALPGIGPYTSAAIAAIAFDQSAIVIDGNVERVITRLRAIETPLPQAKPLIRDYAQVITPAKRPGDFAQAMMDLGATICTARAPKCGVCPLSACAWRAAGFPAGDGPARPVQRYAGTDRQVRGKLLDVLRGSVFPVERAQLDIVWLTDTAQRDRALDSLLVDGLVEQTADGRFALAGEGDDAGPQARGGAEQKTPEGDDAGPQARGRAEQTTPEGDDAGPHDSSRSR